MICAIACTILRPPGAPTSRYGRPSRSSITGVMFVRARLPGAIELAVPASGLNQVMPLFQSTPVPGVTTPPPNSPAAVIVQQTALRSASTAAKCVVQLLLSPGAPAPAGAASGRPPGSKRQGSSAGGALEKRTHGSGSPGPACAVALLRSI